VCEVLPGVWRSRRSPRLANTQAGTRCAHKTRQAMACEPLRTQRPPMVVDAGGDCDICETLCFIQMVLPWSPPVQERRRTWRAAHLNQIQKRA
jgi:hypothetical protein